MPKLYLITFIDADFDCGLPILIVANSKEEAEQKFKSNNSMRFVYDFDIEEVNEVDGYKIKVINNKIKFDEFIQRFKN